MLEDEEPQEGLTSEEIELMQSAIESLEEISDNLSLPVDPRVTALIEIASDYLSEQIENNIRYKMEDEEVVKLNEDDSEEFPLTNISMTAEKMLEELNKPLEQKLLFLIDEESKLTLGEQMENEIQEWFNKGMPAREE